MTNAVAFVRFSICRLVAVAYAETFHGGGFIQRHRVVICIWCALFVTSRNDVIVLFPNQRFVEVCWHNMHIFLYIHSSYFMCQCTEYKLLELQLSYSAACENWAYRFGPVSNVLWISGIKGCCVDSPEKPHFLRLSWMTASQNAWSGSTTDLCGDRKKMKVI